jgi:hypothetical protein
MYKAVYLATGLIATGGWLWLLYLGLKWAMDY